MVMDMYNSIVPKHEDPIYVLEKCMKTSDKPVSLGVFDHLESALHALDFVSRFYARDLEIDDYFAVSRMSKNSLNKRQVQLVIWTCTSESENGCFIGHVVLLQGLRTHDVDREPL